MMVEEQNAITLYMYISLYIFSANQMKLSDWYEVNIKLKAPGTYFIKDAHNALPHRIDRF